MKKLPAAFGILTLLLLQPVEAKEPCEGFKWDVSREHSLFLEKPTAAAAGDSEKSATPVALDRLYELTLTPQDKIRFAAAPSKKMLADGAYAGLVRFRVPKAGQYRVSLNIPVWIDVAVDAKTIPSIDFNGSPGCDTPRKVVVYQLPADKNLTLQFSGGVDTKVSVTLTAVSATSK